MFHILEGTHFFKEKNKLRVGQVGIRYPNETLTLQKNRHVRTILIELWNECPKDSYVGLSDVF